MKTAIVQQPFGLGDIIFAQGVIKFFTRGGYKVYWPVKQEFLNDVRRAYPDGVEWLPESLYVSPHALNYERIQYDLRHSISIPIRWAQTIIGVPYKDTMRAKYDMYGLDWQTWRNHAQWNRDTFSERALLETYDIEPDTEFNLVSDVFGCNFNGHGQIPPINNDLRTIHIKKIDQYSLFDWAALMRRATTIHFVASSNIYLLEMMELKAKEVHLYPRLPHETDHRNYDYILQKHKYILH